MSKKYIRTQQLGNKGEAFFEGLLSEHALVHRIDRSKDLGFDFLCEWVSGESPTRLLFGVQVKTRSKMEAVNKEVSRLNGLRQSGVGTEPVVKVQTLDFWKGFDFPIFCFSF